MYFTTFYICEYAGVEVIMKFELQEYVFGLLGS